MSLIFYLIFMCYPVFLCAMLDKVNPDHITMVYDQMMVVAGAKKKIENKTQMKRSDSLVSVRGLASVLSSKR